MNCWPASAALMAGTKSCATDAFVTYPSAGAERRRQELRFLMRGQADHRDGGAGLPYSCRGFEPVHPRHRDIDDEDIRAKRARSMDKRVAVRNGPDDGEFAREERGETVEHQLVIVGKQDPRAKRGVAAGIHRVARPHANIRRASNHDSTLLTTLDVPGTYVYSVKYQCQD